MSGWLTWNTKRIKILLMLTLILSVAAAMAEEKANVPDWKLKCADGSQVEFRKELAKGPVLISFWALWCKPCLKELPHIDKLGQEFQEQMTVLAVNIDSPQSVARVRPYLRSKGYKVKVPLDTSGPGEESSGSGEPPFRGDAILRGALTSIRNSNKKREMLSWRKEPLAQVVSGELRLRFAG